jgi:hypothetical protein
MLPNRVCSFADALVAIFAIVRIDLTSFSPVQPPNVCDLLPDGVVLRPANGAEMMKNKSTLKNDTRREALAEIRTLRDRRHGSEVRLTECVARDQHHELFDVNFRLQDGELSHVIDELVVDKRYVNLIRR